MQLGFDNSYATVLSGAYAPIEPQGFDAPTVLTYNDALHDALGLPEAAREQAASIFSGSTVPDDARPLAMAYAGHQFGYFSPILGDGRALLLGEVVAPDGVRYDIHLKGSGRTPFSRGGDGLAAIGPVLREHLVSEAMFHLGVPTSRVLATMATGDTVLRQDGPLQGAVLARVARSHLRVGTFQLYASVGDRGMVDRLVGYALERHFPEQAGADNPALALLEQVGARQASLIAAWMGVGFVHGVMNTDNSTISGETLDYGPCAFMEVYDPATVFSSIDRQGRYAFGRQPAIGQWNLARLGEALLPSIADDQEAGIARVEGVLTRFADRFSQERADGLRRKLGLEGAQDDDLQLVEDLLAWMTADRRDHTLTWRQLATSLRTDAPIARDARFEQWQERWHARLGSEPHAAVADRMDAVNPLYIPRNHKVEEALEAASEGDLAPIERMLQVLASPFVEQAGAEDLAQPAPDDFGRYVTFCGT